MAVIDYFNYGMGSQGLATQQNYDPSQYNVKGETLKPTPAANGIPLAVDADNDDRSSQQFKQQAMQAQQDTAHLNADNDNVIIGSSGYRYNKVDDGRDSMAREAAMSFAEGYFSHMGDQNEAIAAGSLNAANSSHRIHSMVQRQGMIQDLESKGYNPLDIDTWIQTGNTKDLITNKGTWKNDGHGRIYNDLTGETKVDPNYQTQEKLTHVDTGDAIQFVNQSGDVVKTLPKGVSPSSNVSGGSIGLDDEEAANSGGYTKNANGQWVKPKVNAKGVQVGWDVAGVKMTDQLNAQQAANQPSAVQIQQNKNIDTLLNAGDDQLEGFTGKADQLLDLDSNVINLQTSEDNRQFLAGAKEIEGYMQNQGVGAAKAMGLSGINTLEEAKRAFKSMPQLDRSSPQSFRNSVQRIKDYVDNYNNEHARNLGATPSTSTSANKLSDEELLKKYGG